MHLNFFRRQSLKARVTIFTLIIFLIGMWSLALFATYMLRQDMQRLLGEQQFSAVSYMAADVNQELSLRLKALETLAETAAPLFSQGAASLQAHLEQRPLLQKLFNGGILALAPDGTAVADVPRAAGRIGVNYMAVDNVAVALKQAKAAIGQPVMGKKLHAPVFGMTVPVRDAQGKVIGALSGAINLGQPNFLDNLSQAADHKSGGYVLLVAPQHRLIVTATDKRRVMEAIPATGVIPQIDRFVQGYEGSAVHVNPLGVEVLGSVKGIPVAGWFVALTLPTAQAFAPIDVMQQRMFFATILLTLLAGALTWWMLRRQLAPLQETATLLRSLVGSELPLPPLPIAREDEIGQVLLNFNMLLERLAQMHEALREAEFRWKFAIEGSGIGVWDWNIQTGSVHYSRHWRAMLGYSEADALAVREEWVHLVHPDDRPQAMQAIEAYLEGRTPSYAVEYRLQCKDQSYRWVHSRGVVAGRSKDEKPLRMIGTHTDITQRKQAETALRIAASAFESQDAMVITDACCVILSVNRAFSASTGYTAEEVVGKTPQLLQSGRHDRDFYRAMWNTIERKGLWQGEIWDRRKNGEIYPKWLSISAVKDDAGAVTHYIGSHHEISDRKNAEDALRKLNVVLAKSKQELRALAAQNEARLEGERKHIAREVHDELGQVLTALRMNLSLTGLRHAAPALNDELQDMKALVDRAIQGVRNVAVNLRPAALDMGLGAAIEWLCSEFTERSGIACALQVPEEDIVLDDARAVVIFRIVQESLTNIARYAQASQVDVNLGLRGNDLGLEVRDNGCGFDVAAAAQKKSFGLLGMSERALAMGGHVDVVSASGQGTVVALSIPLNLVATPQTP